MKAYADYQFYISHYQDKVDEYTFQRLSISASQYIRSITFGKSDTYEGDELKYACCDVVNLYYQLAQNEGKEIVSETNDGYSVTYVAEGKTGETTEQRVRRKAYQIIKTWLLPTGILNRKVGRASDHKCRYYDL